MNTSRRACAVTGAILCLGVLVACGASQPNPGVTNMQPEGPEVAPYVAPVRAGQCLSRGDACRLSHDCCSQWCVNGYCAIRQP